MAFVPGFEYDIFISYSHIDNVPTIPGKPGWVDFFHGLLAIRTQALLGQPQIKIFRDPQLKRVGDFPGQLSEKLSTSAVFVCVLSPSYVQSDWCRRELSRFCEMRGADRIIKVVRIPYADASSDGEVTALFAKIKDVLDCRFYSEDETTGDLLRLEPEVIPEHCAGAIRETDVIAEDLAELFKKLRGSQQGSVAAAAPAMKPAVNSIEACDEGDRITIYLADTTRDMAEKRSEIKTELMQFNCRVLPELPLSQDAELVNRVREDLTQSKLAVHLLGGNYGAVPEMETRSIPRIQYDVAIEISQSGKLEQLVWMPEGTVPNDDRQQKFIDDVSNTLPNFLRTKIEDLKTEIHKKLTPDLPNLWGKENDNGSVNLSLFFHEQDRESVSPIYSYLTIVKTFDVKLPLKDAESFQAHKKLLQTSDAVLLYYGSADEEWFVNIWKLIQRQVLAGKKRPVKAIYAGQPSTTEKNLLQSQDPLILRNYGEFTEESLAPLLQRIEMAKGGAQ